MRKISADYIFPISSPPIKNGVVIIDDEGIILDVLPPTTNYQLLTTDYEGIICPGFINAHCHLELSHLKNKIPEKTGLVGFIKNIEMLKEQKFSDGEIEDAMRSAEDEMLKNGIVAVGDISNTSASFSQKEKSKIKYHTFIEALGFNPKKAHEAFNYCVQLQSSIISHPRLTESVGQESSIVPHAPYSISKKLFQKINDFAIKNSSPLSMHNQESIGENEMFIERKGALLDLLENYFKIDCSSFQATGKTSIQSILPNFSPKTKLQLVHNTFTTGKDIQFVKKYFSSPVYFCFCPNANLYIENRLPYYKIFIEENCKITIGTDSLASNHQLSVLEELKIISENIPSMDLSKLLKWATLNGAEFLGFEKEFGSIEVGKKPGLNLISGINFTDMKLTKESGVKKII